MAIRIYEIELLSLPVNIIGFIVAFRKKRNKYSQKRYICKSQNFFIASKTKRVRESLFLT